MKAPGRLLLALALLGLALGVASAAAILTSHHMSDRGVWAVFNAALGLSFTGTGLYVWWRRPDKRSGALFTWVGFLFFLSAAEFSNNDWLFSFGQVTDPLPIAGLVSDQPLEEVINNIAQLNAAAKKLGSPLDAPFMTLSFLSLSPIPELKLTDQGLVDAINLKLISLIAD